MVRRQIKVSLVPRRTSPLKISRRLGREVVTCKAQCSFRFFPLPPLLFFSFRGRSRFVLVFQSVYQTIENGIKSRVRISHCKAVVAAEIVLITSYLCYRIVYWRELVFTNCFRFSKSNVATHCTHCLE